MLSIQDERDGGKVTSFHQDQQHLDEILQAAYTAALKFLRDLPTRPAGRAPHAIPFHALPEKGMGALRALALFRETYEAGLSGSPGPRYLGFVTGGTTPAALAGDWLVSAYDQNAVSGHDSLVPEIERETIALLRELFNLPEAFDGVFVSGATMANFVALATARQWAAQRMGIDVADQGLWQVPSIPVLGGSPHASILKALSMLGMGRRSVELLPRMPGRITVDPQAVKSRLIAFHGAPAIVVASAGEVNTGEFDDLAALAELCATYGAWLHVDGAFGLFAACDPARAHLLRGLEDADSITADGHKWLNVPYDAGFAFTRHRELQRQVFQATAAYLGEGSDQIHDLTPEDSRRFRALPAWMTLMAYGRSGYRELVTRCCTLAQQLGQGIEHSALFEVLTPVHLNIVCFALRGADVAQRDQFLEALTADGTVLMTPTHFAGKPAVRAAFVNWSTSERDVEKILEALERCAHDVVG
jgi:glutamate/tyrosine decarboxylase-like PLP-dependent enzyme